METVWIGDTEVAVPEITRKVLNDIDWLEELLADIERELERKQNVLMWLGKDQGMIVNAVSGNPTSVQGKLQGHMCFALHWHGHIFSADTPSAQHRM